jgi:Protein of unknown function (DUF938)
MDEMRSADPRQYAPAAARNTGPICAVLGRHLPPSGAILEIGSGTGQHIVAFAAAHPELIWQPSDPDPELRASIAAWTAAAGLANLRPPLDLDVTAANWEGALEGPLAGIVCINLLHIAPWAACEGLMAGAGALLEPEAPLYLYGAFKRGGAHTAPTNAAFDRMLRAHDPAWGVRDLEAVVACAARRDLHLVDVVPMPASNLSLVLRRACRRPEATAGVRTPEHCNSKALLTWSASSSSGSRRPGAFSRFVPSGTSLLHVGLRPLPREICHRFLTARPDRLFGAQKQPVTFDPHSARLRLSEPVWKERDEHRVGQRPLWPRLCERGQNRQCSLRPLP